MRYSPVLGGYFATLILVELVFFAILCSLLYYFKIVFLGRNLYSASNQNTMLQIKEWHTSSSFDPWWHCFPPWLSIHPTLQMANILLPHHWFSLRSLGGVGSTDPRKDTFCTLEGRDKVSDLKKELSPNSIQLSPEFLSGHFFSLPTSCESPFVNNMSGLVCWTIALAWLASDCPCFCESKSLNLIRMQFNSLESRAFSLPGL